MRRETGKTKTIPDPEYFCDQCGKNIPSILDILYVGRRFDSPDFCSMRCIKNWARDEPSIKPKLEQKKTFWGRFI